MEKVLDLKVPGTQGLSKKELKYVTGGFWTEVLKGVAIGIGIAVGVEVLGDWDDFKDGFASAFK